MIEYNYIGLLGNISHNNYRMRFKEPISLVIIEDQANGSCMPYCLRMLCNSCLGVCTADFFL